MRRIRTIVYYLSLLVLGVQMSPDVEAAPDLLAQPSFLTWKQSDDEMMVNLTTRRDISILTVRVSNLDGEVIHRDELINQTEGVLEWKWNGRDGQNRTLLAGQYRIEFESVFADGSNETESVTLRVVSTDQLIDSQRPEHGFAAPAVNYREPSHRLRGTTRLFRRFDNERDQNTTEFRSSIRYSDRGEQYRTDINFAYFERTGRPGNFDNSAARFNYLWGSGDVDFVYRRSLGDFSDPLRLYADFRSQHDKKGIRVGQILGNSKMTILALRGTPSVFGEEHGQAFRLEGRVLDNLYYGLSHVRRNFESSADRSSDSSAQAIDLSWEITDQHRIAFEHALTDTSGGDVSITTGNGQGDRLTWFYTSSSGLKTGLGYTDLSRSYNAAFSDPGNQISGDIHGPEMSISWQHPGDGSYLSNLYLATNAFYYDRHSNADHIDQIDATGQFMLLNRFNIAANIRSREELDRRSTTILLSEQHPLNADWYANTQYNRISGTGSVTHRLLIGASLSRGREFQQRIGMEFNNRTGRFIANGPVNEYGVLISGRVRNIGYESIVRYTHSDNASGTNLYVKATIETLYLHRYAPLAYISLGDRSSIKTADRIETGLEFRF